MLRTFFFFPPNRLVCNTAWNVLCGIGIWGKNAQVPFQTHNTTWNTWSDWTCLEFDLRVVDFVEERTLIRDPIRKVNFDPWSDLLSWSRVIRELWFDPIRDLFHTEPSICDPWSQQFRTFGTKFPENHPCFEWQKNFTPSKVFHPPFWEYWESRNFVI